MRQFKGSSSFVIKVKELAAVFGRAPEPHILFPVQMDGDVFKKYAVIRRIREFSEKSRVGDHDRMFGGQAAADNESAAGQDIKTILPTGTPIEAGKPGKSLLVVLEMVCDFARGEVRTGQKFVKGAQAGTRDDHVPDGVGAADFFAEKSQVGKLVVTVQRKGRMPGL